MPQKVKNTKLRDGIYFSRFEHGGRTYIRSLETRDARVAAQRVKKLIAEVKAQRWLPSGTHAINDAILLAKSRHWPNISPKTRTRYECSYVQLAGTILHRTLDELTMDHLADYAAARRRAGREPGTIRRDLQALSVAYEVAIDAGWTDKNPAKTFLRRASKRGLKENAGRTRIATHAEVADLVMGALQMQRYDEHTRTMLAAFIIIKLETGLRAGELIQMRAKWIDLDRRKELLVPKILAKRSKERWVPLTPLAAECITKLLAAKPCPSGDFLFWKETTGKPFNSLFVPFQRAADHAGIVQHITLHDLRRTCGARLLRGEAGLPNKLRMEEVSMWLGHGSVTVTQKHYAFLNVDNLHHAIGNHLDIEERRVPSLRFLESENPVQNPAPTVRNGIQVIDLQGLSFS